MTRTCYSCKQEKPVSEFYRSNVNYWQRECKLCTKKRRSKWWRTDVGKRSCANTKLKQRFGITIEKYEELVASVGSRCQICGAEGSENGHRLAIDHDHATGEIRGILCKACNVALGRFRDNPALLVAAIAYLGDGRSFDKLKGTARK